MQIVFGANIDPSHADPSAPVRHAVAAEQLGYDFLTVQDHPYQRRHYDAWTLVTYLAARTERITVVPTVACLPLRPPAVLAKSVASLDLLTGGRVQLGLGTGAFWDAIEAMGGPRREPRESVDALIEAIAVLRLMWSGEGSVRFAGTYYQLAGVKPGPASSAGIWLGAYGPRRLRVTGELADGWLPSSGHLPLERLAEASARVDDAATRAGRDPLSLRKVYNLAGMVGGSAGGFAGPAGEWAELMIHAVALGVNGFSFWPTTDVERQLEVFAHEVVPVVRAEFEE